MGPTIEQVDARERLHKLVDELTDAEASDTFEYAVRRHGRGATTGDGDDGWGDLDAQLDAAAHETMRSLDEQEQAAFGETIGEAWRRKRPA
jgi:hypothetical protein